MPFCILYELHSKASLHTIEDVRIQPLSTGTGIEDQAISNHPPVHIGRCLSPLERFPLFLSGDIEGSLSSASDEQASDDVMCIEILDS